MFHKATDVKFLEGTLLEVSFQNGQVKRFDMSRLFSKYPQLTALNDHDLFCSGKLMGAYGIIWNDDLDIETESIYEDGITVRSNEPSGSILAGTAVRSARAKAGISQAELAMLTGIDQSDISRIERGLANPSVLTLARITDALKMNLSINIS